MSLAWSMTKPNSMKQFILMTNLKETKLKSKKPRTNPEKVVQKSLKKIDSISSQNS